MQEVHEGLAIGETEPDGHDGHWDSPWDGAEVPGRHWEHTVSACDDVK